MLTSRWRVRVHPVLGHVLVPIVELEIQNASGPYYPFSVCVDTGAIMSLFPRSAATVLGLNLTAGRPIHLGAVAGAGIDAYIHDLSVRLPATPLLTIPFAIAPRDDVPPLLGRLGVVEQLEITLDPIRRETRIRKP